MDGVCRGCNEGLLKDDCGTPCPANCISCHEEIVQNRSELDHALDQANNPNVSRFKHDFDICLDIALPNSECEECNGITGRLKCGWIYYPSFTFFCTTSHGHCKCWYYVQQKEDASNLSNNFKQCLKNRNLFPEQMEHSENNQRKVVCAKCKAGHYGITCQHNCSETCNNGCNKETGNCTNGCLRGFFGPHCNTTNTEIEELVSKTGTHVV